MPAHRTQIWCAQLKNTVLCYKLRRWFCHTDFGVSRQTFFMRFCQKEHSYLENNDESTKDARSYVLCTCRRCHLFYFILLVLLFCYNLFLLSLYFIKIRVIDDIDRLGYFYGIKGFVWFDDDDELPHRKQKPAIVRAHPFTKMSVERSLYKCSESSKNGI